MGLGGPGPESVSHELLGLDAHTLRFSDGMLGAVAGLATTARCARSSAHDHAQHGLARALAPDRDALSGSLVASKQASKGGCECSHMHGIARIDPTLIDAYPDGLSSMMARAR